MKIKQTILIFALIIGLGGIFNSTIAFAEDSKCAGVDVSILTCDQNGSKTDVQDTGLWGILLLAINILTAGIGVAAVGGIIYGSILYASAGGGPEQVKKAKEIIMNVLLGLAAYALMYAFLNFIIPGGMFA